MKLRYYWTTTLGLLFFLALLDHVTNATMYQYGLQFSWDWFAVYGLAMFMIWTFAGLRSGFLYYCNSSEDPHRLQISIALFVTDVSIWCGGYLDFIWFMIDGKLPALDVNWYWMPQAHIFGFYNTVSHALWVLMWTIMLVCLWYKVDARD